MRDSSEVLEKFRELRDRHLSERKTMYLTRRPINCVYNIRLRVKGKGQLGFCQNSLVLAKCGSQRMFICNDDDTARRCRVFACRNTSESVERDFKDVLSSPARCGNDYPKLAMLIWFLQDFETHGRAVRFGQLIRRVTDALWKIVTFRW